MNLSVIIPIYNEESNINVIYDRLSSVLNSMGLSYELLFVNDGSIDSSSTIIKSLAARDSHVKFINFSRNFGHQVAVSAGLENVSGDACVLIDADLQDPPELIEQLYKKYKEGYEVVYAKRKHRKGESALKKITARIFYRVLAKITSIDIPLDTGDFRIIDRKVINILKNMPEQQKFLRGQIAWIGYKQTFVEYDRDERHGGETKYTLSRIMHLALDGITSFSNLPLRIATIGGFTVSGITVIIMFYALYSRFISKDYVPGWASLILVVLFLGSIQLIGIGIIGEYISRIGNNIRNRPLYIVDDTNIDADKKKDNTTNMPE